MKKGFRKRWYKSWAKSPVWPRATLRQVMLKGSVLGYLSEITKASSTVYRKLTAPPYPPPTPHTEKLLLSLFPRHPNPDLEASNPHALPAATAAHLPSAPLPSGFIFDGTERAELIKL